MGKYLSARILYLGKQAVGPADLRQWQDDEPIETELRRSWHEDMLWWGPAGIGATYTIPRYVEQHVLPFRLARCQAADGSGEPEIACCRVPCQPVL